MQDSELIKDTRTNIHFKSVSFSNYPKKSIFSEFIKSLKSGNIESSCNWAVESHVSGYIDDLWEKIIVFSSQFINTSIPKVPIYILSRYKSYLEQLGNHNNNIDLLKSRNNFKIRYELAEVVTLLSITKKKDLNKLFSIKPYELDLNWIKINKNLKDPGFQSISVISKNECGKIQHIFYQLIYNINRNSKDIHNSIYWLSWLLAWHNKHKNVDSYTISSRNIIGIDGKCQLDIIWLIWETIMSESLNRNNETLSTQIKCLFQMYKFNFTTSKRKSRIPLVIHAITLLTTNIDWTQLITNQQNTIKQVCSQINKIYIDIQNSSSIQSEISNISVPNLSTNRDSSLKNNKKTNISEVSIQKLEAFNRISNSMMNNT